MVAMQDADHDHDGVTSAAEWDAYAERWATALPSELTLNAEQRALALQRQKITWRLRAGAADLQQLRMRAVYVAPLPSASRALVHYTDRSRPLDAGWRELWVTSAAGARIIATTAARSDRSRRLTVFPSLVGDLPNETSTAIEVALNPAGVTATRVDRPNAHAPAATASLPANGLWSLFRLGTHHIATGWDHLVFLLGLLLLSQSLRDLIKIVTAFTLAHSLTLGLAAAGLVTPPGSLIEPLIALTIAYVGLANLRCRAHAHGMPIAFCFGLIHGFGFAGALGATLSGHAVGGHSWLLDLAAFNLGIEVFQVGLLVLVVSLLQRLREGAVGGDGASRCRLQRARCRDLVVCLARQWIVGSRAGASKTNAPA
nr:putative hydrogenase urease accessory protein [uncultured bacterium]